jgi:hypothetical protein
MEEGKSRKEGRKMEEKWKKNERKKKEKLVRRDLRVAFCLCLYGWLLSKKSFDATTVYFRLEVQKFWQRLIG